MKPVALFIPEQTKHGRIFHPANEIARHFAALAGVEFFPEHRLRHIVALAFEVAETNGQVIPIPHPWAKAKNASREHSSLPESSTALEMTNPERP